MSASLRFIEEEAAGGARYRIHGLPVPISSLGSFVIRDYYLVGDPDHLTLSHDLAMLDAATLDRVLRSFRTWFERRLWTRTILNARGLVDQEREILRRLQSGLGMMTRPELIARRVAEVRKSQWLLAEFEKELSGAQAALADIVDASESNNHGGNVGTLPRVLHEAEPSDQPGEQF